jgi:hypothetical protein
MPQSGRSGYRSDLAGSPGDRHIGEHISRRRDLNTGVASPGTCSDHEHPDGWLGRAMNECVNRETRTQPALPLRQRPKIQTLLRLDRASEAFE